MLVNSSVESRRSMGMPLGLILRCLLVLQVMHVKLDTTLDVVVVVHVLGDDGHGGSFSCFQGLLDQYLLGLFLNEAIPINPETLIKLDMAHQRAGSFEMLLAATANQVLVSAVVLKNNKKIVSRMSLFTRPATEIQDTIVYVKKGFYLTDMKRATPVALEVNTADRTGNMVIALLDSIHLELMKKQTFLILEVQITSSAVVMLRVSDLMGFHLPDRSKDFRAVAVGAAHHGGRGLDRHFTGSHQLP